MAGEKRPRFDIDPRRFLTGQGSGQSSLLINAGETLWTQGAPGEEVFFINRGWVKVSLVSPNGKDALLALPGGGEFIGVRCLIEDYTRMGTATTLCECSLIRITKAAVIRLLRQEPDFAQTLVTCVVRQSLRAQRILAEQLTDSSERRLAKMLLRLTNGTGKQRSESVLMRINQADLASMIGTTRARVSYFMNKFRRQGFIDYDRQGHVTVHNRLGKALLEPERNFVTSK
jgi:CRP/FNR family transcriptional regulator, cyclic AMP receptor protein